MRIGSLELKTPWILAPMAGVTDKPFRLLCKELGAGYAVSEMITSDVRLWKTRKSRSRMDHCGEPDPIGVQIAGSDPVVMSDAARMNVDLGAQVIDVNMGCPAKKVCNSWCGSALLQDELLVGRILASIVKSVAVPVTVKIRTGWNSKNRNGVRIAKIAEASGVAMIAVHGRTRDMLYSGQAEYETVSEIKSLVGIPVVVNGDIDSAQKAVEVHKRTRADGVMVGRAAQGRPWIFREIDEYAKSGCLLPEPRPDEVRDILHRHLVRLYDFYGEEMGVRIARKHLGWYAKDRPESEGFRITINGVTSADAQLALSGSYFDALSDRLEATSRPRDLKWAATLS